MTESTGPKKLTPQERARRKARRAWIPTAVIGVLIVVAIIVAITVQNSGTGKPVVLEPGDTVFNAAGIAKMQKDADAQIDVRGVRSASAVHLPANGNSKFGPFPGISAELDLVGVHGTIQSLFVDSFRVITKNDSIAKITTTAQEFSFTGIHNQVQEESVVGITPKQVAAFENAMPVGAGGPASHFHLKVGTGMALGVPTTVAVACDGPKGCTVTTVTTLQTR